MARYSDRRIPKPTQDELWAEFCELVVRLRTPDQVRRFFSDLLNRSERLMIARRLHVAALLKLGFSYRDIKKVMGTGSVTIARVHRWLEFGRGGYVSAIKQLRERTPDRLAKRLSRYYRK